MSEPRIDRLFHVLVVLGGASAIAGCGEKTVERDRGPDAAPSGVDADVVTEADAAPTDDAGNELALCFCDSAPCCDRSGEAPVVQDGFTCCWSTVCE